VSLVIPAKEIVSKSKESGRMIPLAICGLRHPLRASKLPTAEAQRALRKTPRQKRKQELKEPGFMHFLRTEGIFEHWTQWRRTLATLRVPAICITSGWFG